MLTEQKNPDTLTRTLTVDERVLYTHSRDQIIRHMIEELSRAVVADLKPKVIASIDMDEIIQAVKVKVEADLKADVAKVLRTANAPY